MFEEHLKWSRLRIDTYLGDVIEEWAAAEQVPERLLMAMRHAVLGGGKRFRPFLVRASAELFGADADQAMPIAAAVELVHCYSLVHDDLPAMDNDRVRRGQPTVWAAFDEWTAILAGDALLTLAFEVLSSLGSSAAPALRVLLMRELARSAGGGGMVGGQALDLAADKLGEPRQHSVIHVRRLQAMKTGALITYSCRAGALLAGAPAEDVERMTRFGSALGLAFQISDDLLDATGNAVEAGKAVGKDAEQGKATILSLLGVEGARAELEAAQIAAIAALERYGRKAEALRSAVEYLAARKS